MIRTLENCSLIQKCVRKGIGEPEQRNGVCLGYQKGENDDEPCEKCKSCKLNISYEKGVGVLMAEYIEREALKNNLHFTKEGIFYYNGKAYMDLNIVDRIVLEIPTADVVEVQHGEWIKYPSDAYMKCSVCGMEYPKERMPNIVGYCPNPNCGAKMDGGNK